MIHQFDGHQWQPGPALADGNQPFPANAAAGTFFNDVTGMHGKTASDVAEDLHHLLMKQGALAKLLKTPFDWRGLAGRIRDQIAPRTQATLDVAQVVIHADETFEVRATGEWDATLVQDAGQLAVSLLRANGQMDFIRRQPWFKAGTHRVEVQVMVQWGRPVGLLDFHKDTKGALLFVNLVFRSDQVIPSTEWSVDLEEMPGDKEELLEKHWPSELLDALDAARRKLVPPGGKWFPIEGGKLEADGFISWVDELVWHSTPSLAHRRRYTREKVLAILAHPQFSSETYDVLVQMALTRHSSFAGYLDADEIPVEALDIELVSKLWTATHSDKDLAYMMEAWQKDAQSIDWSQRTWDTVSGVSLTRTDPATDEDVHSIQPTGIVGRPRSNSRQLKELLALPGAALPRDMLGVLVHVRPAT